MKARKICSDPQCGELQPCEEHERKPWDGSQRRERTRLSGSRQQKRARYILEKHSTICHVCGHPGGTEADHVIPLGENGPDTTANMRPVHVDCHKAKSQAEAQRARRMAG